MEDSVKLSGNGQNLQGNLEDSLEFFRGSETVNENQGELIEYQKVSLAALTMCCTCDSN